MNTTPAPHTSKHGSSKKLRAGARSNGMGTRTGVSPSGKKAGKKSVERELPGSAPLEPTATAMEELELATAPEPATAHAAVPEIQEEEEEEEEKAAIISVEEQSPTLNDELGDYGASSVEDNHTVDLGFNPFSELDRLKQPASISHFSVDEDKVTFSELAPVVLNSDDEDEGGAAGIMQRRVGWTPEHNDHSQADIIPRKEQHPCKTSHSTLTTPSPRVAATTVRTRAPILIPSNPTSPSSLSRQLKSVQALLPTSPSLKGAGFGSSLPTFAAPRISNVTVSGLSFTNPSKTSTPGTTASPSPKLRSSSGKETRRRSTGAQYAGVHAAATGSVAYGHGAGARARDHARLSMTSTPQGGLRSSDSDDDSSSYMAHPYSPAQLQQQQFQHPQVTQYPSSAPTVFDKVVSASFGEVSLPVTSGSSGQKQHLLMIGYENGLQIWNISNLGNVTEILNRRLSGAVVGCSVLPEPRSGARRGKVDKHTSERPLIGILVEEHDSSYLLVYSLVSHKVVERLDFSGASFSSFQASDSFIVVSTVSPFSLHILCSRTFVILHTIQARQLSIFSRPASLHKPDGSVETIYHARQDRPHAVFDLSARLLAFASLPPAPELSTLTNIYPRMALPQSPAIQLGSISVSQQDVSNAAMKVGGGLLSGMKTLGGLAVSAARGDRVASSGAAPVEGGLRKFFSRSAPAASSSTSRVDRSRSEGNSNGDAGRESEEMHRPRDSVHVTVLDLAPLLDEENDRPETLAEFATPSGQVVVGLRFTEDGLGLGVIPDDGGTVRMYHIKPRSRLMRSLALACSNAQVKCSTSSDAPRRQDSFTSVDSTTSIVKEQLAASAAWHIYDLRRGRTTGVIESLEFSRDYRWTGIASRRRTVHVFATNPYGGKPDEASHIEGRVKNVDQMQPLSVILTPLIRLRLNTHATEQFTSPLAFTFLSSSSDSLPTKLLPAYNPLSSPSSVSSSIPLSSATTPHQHQTHQRTQSVSPRLPARPTNYQDILIFDPVDGSLHLRRITLASRIGESGTAASFLSALPIPTATSMSLPGMGFIGRQGMSPPKTIPAAPATTERLPTELAAKDAIVATWRLSRDPKGSDSCETLALTKGTADSRKEISKAERLAQFELSTSSKSPAVLPSSIYLSHQFTFFSFGEDYHALIRRMHFDVPSAKLDVRREVEARPFSAGHGESFVSGASSPHDVHSARPFDEPITSAMFSGLDYSSSSPPVIPMLPNGGRPGSFKAAIPIRSVASGISEGVNEGIGRLSRSLRKVRSPRLNPHSDESVPLEFDEEDELFMNEHEFHQAEAEGEAEAEIENLSHEGHDYGEGEGDTLSNSGCGGRDSRSVSTPSTNNNAPLPGGETEPEGWLDDMDAVDEAEQFDEVDPVRLMDDERRQAQHAQIRVASLEQKAWSAYRGSRKGH